MKRIRLLSTISSPLVSILLPVKLRSFKAERYLIFKPMSHWKLSERTQLSSPTCTKFCDMDIDEISELYFWYIFMSKLKCLVHGLSYRRCRCLVHSVFLKYVLNCIWSKQAIVLLIINGKITFLNFSYGSYIAVRSLFYLIFYLTLLRARSVRWPLTCSDNLKSVGVLI